MNEAIAREVRKLSVEERIALVEALWDDIARDAPNGAPLSDAQREELERRVVAHQDFPVPGKSLEQIVAENKLTA